MPSILRAAWLLLLNGHSSAERGNAMRHPTTRIAVARNGSRVVSPRGDNALLSPKLPHERDETPDAAKGVDREQVVRAAADLAAGREDTDCYGAARSAFRRAHTLRSK
jgi:hypothetical protein